MEENNEEWRPILYDGKETMYVVSNFGRIQNVKTGYIMQPYNDKDGYPTVCLSIGGKHKTTHLHRYVALAFIPNPENKPQVNHINGIKTDNRVENLEWNTAQENVIHAYKNHLHDYCAIGEEHGQNKYSTNQIVHVCELLQENKKTKKEISYLTGVPVSTIMDILGKKYWTHISDKYDISSYNVRGRRMLSDEQRNLVIKLHNQGYRQCDILRQMGLEPTKTNYGLIKPTIAKVMSSSTRES